MLGPIVLMRPSCWREVKGHLSVEGKQKALPGIGGGGVGRREEEGGGRRVFVA